MSCAIQWVLDASEARSGVVVDGVVARDGSQSVNFSTIGLISAQLRVCSRERGVKRVL